MCKGNSIIEKIRRDLRWAEREVPRLRKRLEQIAVSLTELKIDLEEKRS